ncbi:hypothetical protein B0H11DRAFT_2336173 [Mycena galericulata]|nr:hypothetical protein B0H11DRAFT_2336173 [Mycena galericulata]
MNPTQPYSDDPANTAGAQYDPYRGPVPHTFNEAVHGVPPPEWGQTEAIPMTQMGRGASPAPPMLYDWRVIPGPAVRVWARESGSAGGIRACVAGAAGRVCRAVEG